MSHEYGNFCERFLHMLNNNKVGAAIFFPRLAWILGPFYHKNLTKYC